LEGDLKHMVGLLRKMELDVTSCATRAEAETAVSRLLEKHGDNAFFDLALVDINLCRNVVQADYEGVGFARGLQKRMPECAIALVSGAKGRITDEAFREIAGDLLVVDYLSKPFTMQTFRSWLRQVPKNRRIPACDLLAGEQASAREIERRMAEARQVCLESIVETLGRLRDEIQADKATLFRMHKVSRAVSIVADTGEPFPRLATGAKGLRYSPIRDVCEDRQERCDHRVPDLWLAKHKKLLAICHPLRPYTSCAACPVPEPPGDEHWYALFAFVFAESRWPGKAEGGFQVRQKVVDLLPGAVQSDIRKVLVSHVMREHASYIAQHLLERWHEATQILQYPFLMTGLATSSVGHDLANSLMGADQAISRLQAQVRAGTLNAKGAANELAFLADRTTKAIDIATSFKKQARSQYEVPTTVPLQDVVISVCQAVTFEAERNHVSFEVYGDAAAAIFCQRGAVERILFNLVLNAVQQTGRSLRGGGKVRVEYHYRKGKTGLEAMVRVYDNGPGIQSYRLHSIFMPGETTSPGGSGMGLTIAMHEAARLRARLRVGKSILYCGTCFELALPVQGPDGTLPGGES
jgi:signal transduction histidine kinase/response regulator of citrate/malate metabolism